MSPGNDPPVEDGKAAPRRHLGRGLNALFGDDAAVPPANPPDGQSPRSLPVELLHPGRYQPRGAIDSEALGDLVDSVRTKGVLQPLLVRPDPDQADRYEIIAGERRWRAAQMAQLHEVPVVVRDLTDQQTLEVALVENLQRQDLSILDEALGYRRLMDEFNHTQEALAQAVGKSRSHVANTLRLLGLPEPVKALLAAGKLTAGHARALLNTDDPVALARRAAEQGMSVRQTEQLVARSRKPKTARSSGRTKDPDTREVEENISAILGLPVSIDDTGKGGRVVIRYHTLEQLEAVLGRLSGGAMTPSRAPGSDGVQPLPDEPLQESDSGTSANVEDDGVPDWANTDPDTLLAQIEAMLGGDETESDTSREEGADPGATTAPIVEHDQKALGPGDTQANVEDEPDIDEETERFLRELEQIVGPIPDDLPPPKLD